MLEPEPEPGNKFTCWLVYILRSLNNVKSELMTYNSESISSNINDKSFH